MELIKKNDTKYDVYENLLLERDQLTKEAGQAWTCYIREFGKLMTDLYEEKIECIKCKKTIAYYQNALNHGGVIDPVAIQDYLDQELAAYYHNLRLMLKDNEICGKSKQSSPYEVQRSKTLYRRLAKLIHPDINPETDRQDVLRELWQRILTAYGHNDVKELAELEVLVRKALKDLGTGEIKVEISDIEEKIEVLREEIDEIISTEPYTYKVLLEDEKAVNERKARLEEELKEYQGYHRELEEVIDRMLAEGGLKIQWKMN